MIERLKTAATIVLVAVVSAAAATFLTLSVNRVLK